MRYTFVFCVLLIVTVAWAENVDFKKAKTDCVEELGIKKNDKGRPDREDANKKCLAKCIGLKTGVLNDKGVMDESKLPEKLRAKAKKCDKEATDTDLCKRANAFQKCMFSRKKNKE